jgi:hypothetical protein
MADRLPCPIGCDESQRELLEEHPITNSSDPNARGTAHHRRCRICGRNHYGITVDPVKIGTDGMGAQI